MGDVIEAAGVSRGSFYTTLPTSTTWWRGRSPRSCSTPTRAGHSFLVLAAQQERPEETPAVSRSLARVGLLLDRGGMSSVFEVTLDAMLRLWRDALCAEGEELPDEVVAQLEYAVGGTVGMLSRARSSTEAKRRMSMAFVHERHLWLVARVAEVLGVSPRELAARLERVRRAATA